MRLVVVLCLLVFAHAVQRDPVSDDWMNNPSLYGGVPRKQNAMVPIVKEEPTSVVHSEVKAEPQLPVSPVAPVVANLGGPAKLPEVLPEQQRAQKPQEQHQQNDDQQHQKRQSQEQFQSLQGSATLFASLSPAHQGAMPRVSKSEVATVPALEKSILTVDAMNQGEGALQMLTTPLVEKEPEVETVKSTPVHVLPEQSAPAPAPAPAPATTASTKTTQQLQAVEPSIAKLKKEDIPNLVIAIPTMRRWTHDRQPAPERYLKPLVQGIVASMTSEYRDHVSFLLLNVDKEPENHTELHDLVASGIANFTVLTKSRNQHIDMSQFVPKNSHGLFDDPTGREVSATTLNWRAGETMDAPRLLLQAHSLAPYVLFIEDDVSPTADVIPKIYQRILNLQTQGRGDFFMLDLYTPAIEWGPESIKNPHDLESYDFECCTQAMLFNSAYITDLAAYEFEHTDLPVDDNIREFVRADPSSHPVYSVVPNLFEHVGAYSSNPEKSTGVVEHRSLYFEP